MKSAYTLDSGSHFEHVRLEKVLNTTLENSSLKYPRIDIQSAEEYEYAEEYKAG